MNGMRPIDVYPVNIVQLSMGQLTGLQRIVDQYDNGQITASYFEYACRSICPDLKKFHRNQLEVKE